MPVAGCVVAAGTTAVLIGPESMLAVGTVLIGSDRTKTRAALIQLVPALLAIGLLVIGLVSR